MRLSHYHGEMTVIRNVFIGQSAHAGIVAAAVSHAYIWVHYLTTEKPDMEVIYR